MEKRAVWSTSCVESAMRLSLGMVVLLDPVDVMNQLYPNDPPPSRMRDAEALGVSCRGTPDPGTLERNRHPGGTEDA